MLVLGGHPLSFSVEGEFVARGWRNTAIGSCSDKLSMARMIHVSMPDALTVLAAAEV